MDDLPPTRRRDPAWAWYSFAAAAVLLLVILDLAGVLDRLGP